MRLWFLLLVQMVAAQPLFNGITLEQFGVFTNNNTTLFPQARFNPNEPLRTNDYQALQQKNATTRQVVRMGAFYISQGPEGPGISLPAVQTNTTDSITTPLNNVRMIFGAVGVSVFQITTNILTTQAMTVTYFPQDNTGTTIIDFQIIGNAYHDLQYTSLAPTITFEGSTINTIAVDDGPEQPFPLRFGTKFRITLANGQVFLLYVEDSLQSLSLRLNINRTVLTSNFPFTGFIRVAAVQVTPPPNDSTALFVATSPTTWSTTIVQQTSPATPLSMFMLWPVSWTGFVGNQITTLIQQRFNVPDCPLVAQLLPVLALTNFPAAESLFNQLRTQGLSAFGDDTNPFLTYFNMVLARNLSPFIAAYQTTPPIPNPPCTVAPLPIPTPTISAALTEQAFDANRATIPIEADVEFLENQHGWTYTTNNNQGPLIIYPSWKLPLVTVCPPPPSLAIPPIAGFVYADAIKGNLFGQIAFNQEIFFVDRAVPTWYNLTTIPLPTDPLHFFPDFLTISRQNLGTLQNLFNRLPTPQITRCELVGATTIGTCDNSNLVLDVGRQVFKLAYTAKAAALILSLNGQGLSRIQFSTEPYINAVKAELTAWLFTHTRDNFAIEDFFAADITTGGICASAGMSAASEASVSVDDGNAIYNDHDLQYGYWLAAAAIVAEWDVVFNTQNPWLRLAAGLNITNKDRIDMLWRDARNPDKKDPQLPFNRHGNPWEGHSTSNGARYTVLSEGRFQERFAEDFHSWLATNLYARAVLFTNLPATASQGFDTLATFSQTNLQMTATSGKLVYQDTSWLYGEPYTVNFTVGTVTDTTTTNTTSLEEGTSCPIVLR